MALARTDPELYEVYQLQQSQTIGGYMPNVREMLPSKYLKKEDVGEGVLATIHSFEKVNVAVEGAEPEYKWAVSFKELDKPLVLNSTNIHVMQTTFGSENTDDWIGKQIVLYNDPNVSFAGKMTGGIRVRAPRTQQKPDLPF